MEVVVIRIVDGSKEWKISIGQERIKVRELLEKIGLLSNEYVVVKNGQVVSEEEIVNDDDEIVLYPVVSGG
ncbi:MAG: MoaD/ThiS family protein [Staphylothermus sp.]|nr:MoaD/ThiS family protein [Staphylothermus sp.]